MTGTVQNSRREAASFIISLYATTIKAYVSVKATGTYVYILIIGWYIA